jgi:glycosyltransferase involved in cell wall biosynthesis
VSILIRTIGRGAWLRQALETVAQRAWPNVEAIVIEDGPQTSQPIVDEFRRRLVVRYRATGDKVGRARRQLRARRSAESGSTSSTTTTCCSPITSRS